MRQLFNKCRFHVFKIRLIKITSQSGKRLNTSLKYTKVPCLYKTDLIIVRLPCVSRIKAMAADHNTKAINSTSLNDKLKQLRDDMFDQRKMAQDILDSLDVISKDNFKRAFFFEVDIVKASQLLDMESQFTLYINEFKEAGSYKSAELYHNALHTLLAYRGNVDLQDIDEKYLTKYEAYMKSIGNSPSTVSMYQRALRAVFNSASSIRSYRPRHTRSRSTRCSLAARVRTCCTLPRWKRSSNTYLRPMLA